MWSPIDPFQAKSLGPEQLQYLWTIAIGIVCFHHRLSLSSSFAIAAPSTHAAPHFHTALLRHTQPFLLNSIALVLPPLSFTALRQQQFPAVWLCVNSGVYWIGPKQHNSCHCCSFRVEIVFISVFRVGTSPIAIVMDQSFGCVQPSRIEVCTPA